MSDPIAFKTYSMPISGSINAEVGQFKIGDYYENDLGDRYPVLDVIDCSQETYGPVAELSYNLGVVESRKWQQVILGEGDRNG